jgi:LmbE family N-acetylglucosaminyl deacetylase
MDLLLKAGRGANRIVCIGAHCDDIEIGCGGALLALQKRRNVVVDWIVLSGTEERKAETATAMRTLLRPSSRGKLLFGDLSDGRFPTEYLAAKNFLERVKRKLSRADLVMTHERDDRHQDHRLVNELTWNTYRDQMILEYEIPKWDGGLGQPNLYVPVSAAQAKAKAQMLMSCFKSQRNRDWFTRETFLALMRLRGIECRAPDGYAEAFHARKLRLVGG